jgi:hypothetical protein
MPKLQGGIPRILYEQCSRFYAAATTRGTNYLHHYEHGNAQEDKKRQFEKEIRSRSSHDYDEHYCL